MDDELGNDEQPDEGVNVRFYVPPEQEAGVYAESVAVWHTPYASRLIAPGGEANDLSDDHHRARRMLGDPVGS